MLGKTIQVAINGQIVFIACFPIYSQMAFLSILTKLYFLRDMCYQQKIIVLAFFLKLIKKTYIHFICAANYDF